MSYFYCLDCGEKSENVDKCHCGSDFIISRADDDVEQVINNREVNTMTEKEIEALVAAHAQLQQEIADLKVKLTEAEVNFKAVSDIRTTVEKELDTVKAELKVYKDKEIAEAEKNKAETDKKKFEARLGEVPEIVRENLDKHANKELVLARWRDASDQDWDIIKQGFALAYNPTSVTYLTRSRDEGRLPVVSDDKNDNDLKKFLRE